MSTTLFVGGLAFTTTEHDLQNYFKKFGEIEQTSVVKDRWTGASKGYGFVFFLEESTVKQVLAKKSHRIKGRQVDCQAAKKKSEKQKYKEILSKTRIFVTCLPHNINNKDMEHFFTQFGPVKSAYVIRDPCTEKSLGYGFVIFDNPVDAEKVVKNPDLWLKGEKIECNTYKENEENKEGCFDPVRKRMLKIGATMFTTGENSKVSSIPPFSLEKEDSKFVESRNLETMPQALKSGDISREERKKRKRGVDLFGYDEEKLRKEEKLIMEKSYKKVRIGILKYSHMFGGNLRLNAPWKDNKRRRHTKKVQNKKIIEIMKRERNMSQN